MRQTILKRIDALQQRASADQCTTLTRKALDSMRQRAGIHDQLPPKLTEVEALQLLADVVPV
jgi:hypothetical protein